MITHAITTDYDLTSLFVSVYSGSTVLQLLLLLRLCECYRQQNHFHRIPGLRLLWRWLSAVECHHRHVRTHTVLAVVKYILKIKAHTPHYLGLYHTLKNDVCMASNIYLLELFVDPLVDF